MGMSKGELIVVKGIALQEFSFRLVPSREEQCQIRSEMANMLKRGYDELLDIEDAIQDTYKKHIAFNHEQHGKEIFEELHKRYVELFRLRREAANDEEKKKYDDEQDDISLKINENKYFKRFIDFTNTKDLLEDFATMKITCVEPKNFNWKSLKGEEELELIKAYNQKKNLLRLSKDSKS